MSIENKISKKIGEIFDEIDYNDLEKKDLIYFLEQKDLMLGFLQQRIDKAIEYINDSLNNPMCYERGVLKKCKRMLEGEDKE